MKSTKVLAVIAVVSAVLWAIQLTPLAFMSRGVGDVFAGAAIGLSFAVVVGRARYRAGEKRRKRLA